MSTDTNTIVEDIEEIAEIETGTEARPPYIPPVEPDLKSERVQGESYEPPAEPDLKSERVQ
jgi:hypothetical protein